MELQTRGNVKTLNDTRGGKFLSLAVGNGYICAGTSHCTIAVWSIHSFALERALTGHAWEVWQLVINDTLLFSGSFDHTIRIWDMGDWECVRVIKAHTGYVHALLVPEVNVIVSGSSDKSLKLFGLPE